MYTWASPPSATASTACERCTVVRHARSRQDIRGSEILDRFVEGAYQVGLDAYRRVSAENLPAKLQEQGPVRLLQGA